MEFRTSRKLLVTFSTISLTDIVLLLLIFFLLSSTFIVQTGIKVDLPKATSAQPESKQQITLTITKSGEAYLNQERVSEGELAAKIRGLLVENPDQMVVIKGDKDLTLETTIRFVDLAKQAGVGRFLIATQPSEK